MGGQIASDQILSLAGDANRGRTIFNKSSAAACKQCHAVQGFGGSLGPDLSNIGKKYERKSAARNDHHPSKAIAPEFIPYVLETNRGTSTRVSARTHGGTRRAEGREEQPGARGDGEIEALVPQQKSLMPELILSEVTAQDAADLSLF